MARGGGRRGEGFYVAVFLVVGKRPHPENCPTGRLKQRTGWRIAVTPRLRGSAKRLRLQCAMALRWYNQYGNRVRRAPIVAATLGTGAEKSPTDRVEKARDWLVALMHHTEPAGERIDAYGLPIGRKISQHSRPPDRLERQRPIIYRKGQDAEIGDDCSTLWLGSEELLYLLPAGRRRKLGRYPLQHCGHRRGRSRRPQAIHNFASNAPERLLARRGDRDDAGADKDAAVAGFN